MAAGFDNTRTIDPRGPLDPAADALRLLQVLEQHGRTAADSAQHAFENAALLSFADYAETFRLVQEFLSFCDILEGRLENLNAQTREMVQTEVEKLKLRCFMAMLKAMGAYLMWSEKRGMVNLFSQAVFLIQIEMLTFFREHSLPQIPKSLVPDTFDPLMDEVQGLLKRLMDKSPDMPDFRFEA